MDEVGVAREVLEGAEMADEVDVVGVLVVVVNGMVVVGVMVVPR
jgi:hypothetical protein